MPQRFGAETKKQHPFQSAAQNYECLRVLNKRLEAVEALVNLGERGRIAPADEARRGKCGARNGRNQTLLKEQLREVLGALDDLAVHGLAEEAFMFIIT